VSIPSAVQTDHSLVAAAAESGTDLPGRIIQPLKIAPVPALDGAAVAADRTFVVEINAAVLAQWLRRNAQAWRRRRRQPPGAHFVARPQHQVPRAIRVIVSENDEARHGSRTAADGNAVFGGRSAYIGAKPFEHFRADAGNSA